MWTEAQYCHFDNPRRIASYAGIAPTPWQSGSIDREQVEGRQSPPPGHACTDGLALVEASAEFSALQVVSRGRRKKSTIVALARKLLVALWKYVTSGVVMEGVITNKS
ncbi:MULTISPECIES: transposase [unclassified Mesorhizobium]|uniref:transposase n=1 Tax=unclassified Mesorhizobium TaxID=325217 RepID=UPI0032AEC31F